jgi:hypothetical protein
MKSSEIADASGSWLDLSVTPTVPGSATLSLADFAAASVVLTKSLPKVPDTGARGCIGCTFTANASWSVARSESPIFDDIFCTSGILVGGSPTEVAAQRLPVTSEVRWLIGFAAIGVDVMELAECAGRLLLFVAPEKSIALENGEV